MSSFPRTRPTLQPSVLGEGHNTLPFKAGRGEGLPAPLVCLLVLLLLWVLRCNRAATWVDAESPARHGEKTGKEDKTPPNQYADVGLLGLHFAMPRILGALRPALWPRPLGTPYPRGWQVGPLKLLRCLIQGVHRTAQGGSSRLPSSPFADFSGRRRAPAAGASVQPPAQDRGVAATVSSAAPPGPRAHIWPLGSIRGRRARRSGARFCPPRPAQGGRRRGDPAALPDRRTCSLVEKIP